MERIHALMLQRDRWFIHVNVKFRLHNHVRVVLVLVHCISCLQSQKQRRELAKD